MNAHDAIKLTIDSATMIGDSYLKDLSDAELLHRPAPGGNHINWQLGHLIASEHQLVKQAAPESARPLPAGFAEKYTRETAKLDDPKAFCSKEELLKAQKEQRAATLAAMSKLSDADFDKPSGMDWAPTLGALYTAAAGGHWLMHVGQWAVVRRQLGRPPLF